MSTTTTTTTTTRDRGDRYGPMEWAQLGCITLISAKSCHEQSSTDVQYTAKCRTVTWQSYIIDMILLLCRILDIYVLLSNNMRPEYSYLGCSIQPCENDQNKYTLPFPLSLCPFLQFLPSWKKRRQTCHWAETVCSALEKMQFAVNTGRLQFLLVFFNNN